MRLVISQFISLDGVVQAPGGPEEDTDGGFAHGGWSMPYFDPETALLPGDDAAAAVKELKDQHHGVLGMMGSSQLSRTLVQAGLVDEYRLLIEPVLLGGGKTVFPTDGEKRPLELVRATTAASGVLCCVYRPGQTPPMPHGEG